MRAGGLEVALAETTKDNDVALDLRALVKDPRVETAMRAAGVGDTVVSLNFVGAQPGAIDGMARTALDKAARALGSGAVGS